MKKLPLSSLKQIAILGNYLPRQCGIAAFTSDLARSIQERDPRLAVDIAAMTDDTDLEYPEIVKLKLPFEDQDAYRNAADFLNRGSYDAVLVQHEYGIFGGLEGEHLLVLLREIRSPIVTTLHTIVSDPEPAMRRVTEELIRLSDRIVVMSSRASAILACEYGIDPQDIDLIPHGVPDPGQASAWNVKEDLKIAGPMILTFGLLSPDKGIQYAIEALPDILRESPDAVYVVLGATHPQVKALAGEAYRQSLINLADRLGVSGSLRFVDRFVSQEELVAAIKAADVYVTPYLNPKQITSGTLAYAVGLGKAVVSTPYVYAEELLAHGRGSLVPFRDAGALAQAILIEASGANPDASQASAKDAGASMAWSRVAGLYLDSLGKAISQRTLEQPLLFLQAGSPPDPLNRLPALSAHGLIAMSDSAGVFQHSFYSVPDRGHGYCVDDNARALLFTVLLDQAGEATPATQALQRCTLSFVHHSFCADTGRFRNFMSFDRRWLESEGSEDSHGRTMWTLGAFIGRIPSGPLRRAAADLFGRGWPALMEMTSPQTWAYGALAGDEFLASDPLSSAALALRERCAGRLYSAYLQARSPGWHWFEDVVSYANGRMSQALIRAGQGMQDPWMLSCGLESLEWLMDQQTAPEGHFRPIGSNGFWREGQSKAVFDQQPVEAWSSLSASISAARATGDRAWMERAENAFQWFLGRNDLGVPLYDPETGGCFDGLHFNGVNANQGAESCLSYLCALAELRAMQPGPSAAKRSASTL